jgi:ABC-2 type transport system permease protein
MIKPHSRTKILFSKYVTVFLLAIAQYLGVFIVALTLGTASFGFYNKGTQLSNLISTFANGSILPLVFLVTIAFMLSVLTKSSAIAISFGIGLQTIGQLIGALIQAKIQWFSKFYLFSIMDFNNLPVHATKTSSTIVLITYFIIFMLITFTYFNKKDIV